MRNRSRALACLAALAAAALAVFLSLGFGGTVLRGAGGAAAARARPTAAAAAAAAAASFAAGAGAAAGAPQPLPTLVYVLLGAPRFQHHVLDSIRQSRLLNPRLRIVLVADAALYEQRPEWPALLRGPGMRVRLVNASGLESDFAASFRARYESTWRELLTFKVREGMLPSVQDERGIAMQNDDFTRFTAERLFVLHALMRTFALENVMHIENDQMMYGSIQAVKDAADACGVRLAMTRVGTRLAPATASAIASLADSSRHYRTV
jgi:hypothetical protein